MIATQVFVGLVGAAIALGVLTSVCEVFANEVQERFGDGGTFVMDLAVLWGVVQALFWVGSKLHDMAMAIPLAA